MGGSGLDCFQYDPRSAAWSRVPRNKCFVSGASTAFANGLIYVVGGGFLNGFTYNPDSGVWSVLTPMNVLRQYVVACSIGEKVYVIGGDPTADGAKFANVASVEVLDQNGWTVISRRERFKGTLSACVVSLPE